MKFIIGPFILVSLLNFDITECFSTSSIHKFTIFTLTLGRDSPKNAHGMFNIRLNSNGQREDVKFNDKNILLISDTPMYLTKKIKSIASVSTIQVMYERSSTSKAEYIIFKTLFIQDDQRGEKFNLCANNNFLFSGQWVTLNRC